MRLFKVFCFSVCVGVGCLTLSYAIFPLDWLFGSTKVDVKNLKNSVDKNFSDIAAGINDNKTGINDVSGKVKTMSDNVLNLSSKITATAQVPVDATVGYSHDNSQATAGRDMHQKTVDINDTGLMKAMLGSSATMTFSLLIYVRLLSKQRSKVEERLMELMREKDEDYRRLVDQNNATLNRILQENAEYKATTIKLAKGDEDPDTTKKQKAK